MAASQWNRQCIHTVRQILKCYCIHKVNFLTFTHLSLCLSVGLAIHHFGPDWNILLHWINCCEVLDRHPWSPDDEFYRLGDSLAFAVAPPSDWLCLENYWTYFHSISTVFHLPWNSEVGVDHVPVQVGKPRCWQYQILRSVVVPQAFWGGNSTLVGIPVWTPKFQPPCTYETHHWCR